MTYFYLIRHADKQTISGDPSITDFGNKQAEYTGKYLKKFPISHIYNSPLKRAKATAKIIAEILHLKVVLDERLKERINWYREYNMSFGDFIKMWNKTNEDRDYQPQFGDSSRKSGQRMELIIKEFSEKYKDSHIVFLTHGGIIADFLFNIFSEKKLRKFNPDFIDERAVQECSITKVVKDGNGLELLELASVEHLQALIK